MRLVFAGTPEFAQRALAALLAARHEVMLVVTQPDRPAGRGQRLVASPVKRFSLERGLPIAQPGALKSARDLEPIALARPDALVVAAYGLILPPALLDLAPLGAINIHASLLPRWRGAAPIQRALLAGDAETGVSIMKMDAGLDTGPILAQRSIAISEDDDAGSLHHRLAHLGAEMIVAALADLAAGTARERPQPQTGVTYARKIEKGETVLDWSRPAVELARAVRAFRPAPGARASLRGEPIKVLRAFVAARAGEPGKVLHSDVSGIVVACGEQSLALTELQRAGGRVLDAGAFLRGFPIAPGDEFLIPERAR